MYVSDSVETEKVQIWVNLIIGFVHHLSSHIIAGQEKSGLQVWCLSEWNDWRPDTTLADTVELSIETAILIGIIRRFCILESFGNCRRMTAALADFDSTMGFHKVPLSLKEKRKLSQMWTWKAVTSFFFSLWQ